MADLCRRLGDAREASGLSLEDISARTRIKVSTLRALEAGAFDSLPGDFYTRAFLKNYSRELHLPVEEILAEYDALRQPPAAVTIQNAATAVGVLTAPPKGPRTIVIRIPENAHIWLGGALAIAAVIVLAVVTRPSGSPRLDERQPVAATTPAAADPAPVGTAGKEVPPEKLTIEIRPTAPIWVAATADGSRALYRLLEPGEAVVVEARKELSFRVGNAGAFVYSINGVPGRSVGQPGEVREFDITSDNYQSFRR